MSHLSDELIVSLSRSAAEAAALTGAANYEIPANLLDADTIKLKELGFFDTLLFISVISRENLVVFLRTCEVILIISIRIQKLVVDTGVIRDTVSCNVAITYILLYTSHQ